MFFALRADANEDKTLNWSFKLKESGQQPEFPKENSQAVTEAGGLFLGNKEEKRIYLTFDCGYSNENLEKILDILNKHQAVGAFFILPGIIKNSPRVVERMADEGHLVCNHSSTHPNIANLGTEELKHELQGAEDAYFKLTGKQMERFFRPPQGAFSKKSLENLQTLGYTPVFWSFAYADWDNNKQPNPDKSLEKLISATHNGMVLLLHPTSKTNADILDAYLTEMEARGYSFGTLQELKDSL